MTTLAESKDDARRVLATMWAIRRFEEAVDEMFARGLLYGTMHLSIGPAPVWPCATTMSSPRPTVGMATASPRGPTWAA